MSKIKKQNPLPPKGVIVEKGKQTEAKPKSKYSHWIFAAVLALVAILIYSNTFHHRFVLDDHGIIKNNKITKASVSLENTKLIFSTPHRKGDFSDLENSLYRPFTKLVFNIEWNVFQGNAHAFHIVNTLLYALIGIFMFLILYDIFQKKWVVAFLTTLLFIVHPIHTEVVANVKSADEILSLLGSLMALRCLQLYFTKEKMLFLVLAVLSFLMGLFSKESTVVIIGIIPLFIYFFSNLSIKKNAIISSIMAACAFIFLICRWKVLHIYPAPSPLSALDNYMVLCKNPAYPDTYQFPSAVHTLGLYIQTFFYPYPLSCDYSYSTMIPVGFTDIGFLVSFLLFIAMFVFAIWKWKEKSVIGFGFLWFFVSMSLTSNVFMLIGTSFGERLLFVPSLGLCLSLVYALSLFLNKEKSEGSFFSMLGKAPLLFGIVFLVSSMYMYKTYARNNDWESDFGLFSKDIESYPNSTHLLFYMGNHLSGTERKEVLTDKMSALGYTPQQINDSSAKESAKSIYYLSKSLSIYPALPSDGYNQLGKAYFNIGQLDSAYKYYTRAFKEDTTNSIFTNNIGTVFYNKGLALRQTNPVEAMQLFTTAIPFFLKANLKDTTESDFMNNIACVYGITNRYDSAIYWFKKASDHDSLDLTSVQFLDMTYRNKGDSANAQYYRKKADYVRMRRTELLHQ